MLRREFVRSSAALAAFAPLAVGAAEKPKRRLRKGYMFGGLRPNAKNGGSLLDRFKLLKDAGFDGVEVSGAMDQKEVLAARDAAGLEIPSVVIHNHWTHPITSPNPGAREIGLEGLRQGLRDAKAYGASSVLFVPAVVNQDTSYADAYTRAVEGIRQAIPLAEELGVAIAIENVWNKFLLSPLEAAAFVDQFETPAVKWHFDVGNVVDSGWPEQWIRILGSRIVKIHVKEYSRKLRDKEGPYAGFRTELFSGDSNWPAVVSALDAVGYSGWLISEQYRTPGLSDPEWLKNLAGQMDRIIAL
jgi:L-ribulose-5-phosphate 3-epimerase